MDGVTQMSVSVCVCLFLCLCVELFKWGKDMALASRSTSCLSFLFLPLRLLFFFHLLCGVASFYLFCPSRNFLLRTQFPLFWFFRVVFSALSCYYYYYSCFLLMMIMVFFFFFLNID
jgi:hypothetical protein